MMDAVVLGIIMLGVIACAAIAGLVLVLPTTARLPGCSRARRRPNRMPTPMDRKSLIACLARTRRRGSHSGRAFSGRLDSHTILRTIAESYDRLAHREESLMPASVQMKLP